MSELAIKIENVSKEYRLGAIGGTTLREEVHRWMDRLFRHNTFNPDYGKKFKALDGINLDVKKGEALGIIGHNGAGKSTLLKLISRVTGPTTGTISFNGRITSMLEVGTGFHGELTGRENIYMNGAILGMSKKEIESKMDAIIDFAEIDKFIDTPVKRYSSGMYVRLAFSVAAHLDSEIMIMDEVLAVGDTKFQEKCLNKMKSTSTGDNKTILYVSHNLNTIQYLCSRAIVLEKGKMVFDGSAEDAISFYLRKEVDNKTSRDLSNIPRNPWCKLDASFLRMELLDCVDCKIRQNGILKFQLDWKCKDDVASLVLRFRVFHKSGVPVAFSTIGLGDGNAGMEYSRQFQVGMKGIIPGEYFIDVEFHTIAIAGATPLWQDGLTQLFMIEIENGNVIQSPVGRKDLSYTIQWPRSQGSVRLDMAEV